MILLIDNYDSFTYNLVQRIGELYGDCASLDLKVIRNDKITVDEAMALEPTHLIISPGPCTPREAGISCELVKEAAGKIPLLGVCLGHQSIGYAHGMTVNRNDRIMHGKTSEIKHDGRGVFRGLPNPFIATRYHSLVIRQEGFDHERFEISAQTKAGEIMGIRAKENVFGPATVEGVQFHPESFLCPHGPHLLANFLGLSFNFEQFALPEMA